MESLITETQQVFSEKETEQTWSAFNAQLRKWEQVVLDALAASRASASSPISSGSGLPLTHPLRAKLLSSLGPFGPVAPHIQASIASERTILSATACDVVKAVAAGLATEFDGLMEVFGPSLLKLCQRSNKVFTKRAEETLLAVIDDSKSVKWVPILCENMSKQNKNKQAKASAAKALVRLLQVAEFVVGIDGAADALTVAIAEVGPHLSFPFFPFLP